MPNRFVERFPASAQASMTRCILCDAVELGHVCPYASGQPVPPVVAVSAAWSERFAMFAFVGLFGALVSAVFVPSVLGFLLPFSLMAIGASVVFRAIPWVFARTAPAALSVQAQLEADPRIALRAALLRARGRISPALTDRLRRVRGTIEAGLAHADKASTGDLDTHILRESALHYVPEAIDYYLTLPANAPRTLEGRTAEQELDYQLALIEERVQKVLDGKARDLVDDFEAHGRFLRERLSGGSGALDIPAPTAATASTAAAERERVRAQ